MSVNCDLSDVVENHAISIQKLRAGWKLHVRSESCVWELNVQINRHISACLSTIIMMRSSQASALSTHQLYSPPHLSLSLRHVMKRPKEEQISNLSL